MKKGEKKSATTDNSSGVAATVLGIQSIAFSLVAPLMGIILGIVSLAFAKNQNTKAPNKWSTAGKVLSIIGIVVGIIQIVLAIYLFSAHPQLLPGGAI